MAPAAVIFPAERWYEIDTPANLGAAELVFPSRRLHVVGGSEPRALCDGRGGP